MLDWLTLKTDIANLETATYERLRDSQSRTFSVDPDGALKWERFERQSVRSDSHQITIELGGELRIYGSPARVDANRADNVFGSGDPVECAQRMIDFLAVQLGAPLPPARLWDCTRMDVTHNYHLGDKSIVIEALGLLRHVEGGRFQVRTSAETVYWSSRSLFRSGKAYAKGPHMDYLAKKGQDFLTEDERAMVQSLLRLELSLKRHFFKRFLRKPWYELSERELDLEHEKFFGALVGKVEIRESTDIRQQCVHAALGLGLSEGYGKAAFLSWNTICSVGFTSWRANMPKSTMYRHLKILKTAGLSFADFNAGKVVPIRRRRIVLDQPVRSWADLRLVA